MVKKIIIGLIIVLVVVGNIACNRQKEKQEAQQIVTEAPSEAPKKSSPAKTKPQAMSSPIAYDIPDELRSKLDMPTFDRKLQKFLAKDANWPLDREGKLSLVTVKNDGWVQVNFNDGSLVFDLQLQTHDRKLITCSVSNGEYYFEVEE